MSPTKRFPYLVGRKLKNVSTAQTPLQKVLPYSTNRWTLTPLACEHRGVFQQVRNYSQDHLTWQKTRTSWTSNVDFVEKTQFLQANMGSTHRKDTKKAERIQKLCQWPTLSVEGWKIMFCSKLSVLHATEVNHVKTWEYVIFMVNSAQHGHILYDTSWLLFLSSQRAIDQNQVERSLATATPTA